MNIIMTMMKTNMSMNIIMTMTENAAADMIMSMDIIITIMRMTYLTAGVQRHLINTTETV